MEIHVGNIRNLFVEDIYPYAIMRTMCGIFTMIYLQNWVISDVRANVGIHIPAPCFANMGNYLGHQFIEGKKTFRAETDLG